MPSGRLKVFLKLRENIAAATAMMLEANVTRKLMKIPAGRSSG
jgi:hypothetical protein